MNSLSVFFAIYMAIIYINSSSAYIAKCKFKGKFSDIIIIYPSKSV